MTTRKISECINVRINVGNYQHIELVKYAEEEIEFSSVEERMAKEDQLTLDLVASLSRSMKLVTESLGKGMAEVIKVEQSIKKAIPEWMKNGAVPNIANNPRKLEIQVAAAQEDQKAQEVAQSAEVLLKSVEKEEVKLEGKDDDASEEPLFEDSLDAGKGVEDEQPKATTAPKAAPEKSPFDGNDDDLF